MAVLWGTFYVRPGSPVLSLTTAVPLGFHHVLVHIVFLMGGPLMASSSAATVVLCDSSTLVP